MRYLFCCLFVLVLMCCKTDIKHYKQVKSVDIETKYANETLSVRALDFNKDFIFYGTSNHFGKRALHKEFKVNISDLKITNGKNHFKYVQNFEDKPLHFRAIEAVNDHLFALSIANPARLYKLSVKTNTPILVYEEFHKDVFYNSLAFWNSQEGIAMGDPTDNCISIIITRDTGNTWAKLPCDVLPQAKAGEAAFAASNTNIAIVGNKTWIATGGTASRILFSPDKGHTWEVFDTPVVQGKETTGIYSIDFYDDKQGFGIGGDYTKPADSTANKIRTSDGGKTWRLVAENQSPGYRSCVQYIPNSNAKELVAVGFKGIDYSKDGGDTWTHLSDEGFYTIRFINDSTAYAAGKGRISQLIFR